MEHPQRAKPIPFAISVGTVVLLAAVWFLINRYWLPAPPREAVGSRFFGMGFVTGIHVVLFLSFGLAGAIWLFRQPDDLEARCKLALPLFLAAVAILVSFNSFTFGGPRNWSPETFMPLFFYLVGWMSLKKQLAKRNIGEEIGRGGPTDEAQQVR